MIFLSNLSIFIKRKAINYQEKEIISREEFINFAMIEKILLRAKEVHALLHLFNPRFY